MDGKPLVASEWRARCENCEHEWNYNAEDGITQCPKCGSPDHLDGGYRIRYLTESGSENEIPPCNFELKSDGKTVTMKILCKECGHRELKDRNCFSSLLRAFANEVNVDKIILQNHVETQYFGKALAILKGMTSLSYEMKQLSLRVPTTPSGRTPKGCSECQLRPKEVFTMLNEQFLKDVGLFYSVFHDTTIQLYEKDAQNRSCGECMLATREDFDYIYPRFETLLRDIVKEGVAIVV